jgi:predicted Zn-dependent peptidase
MFMATGAPPEKVDELKQVWKETLDEIARDGITRDELAAAKTYLEGRRLHERESNLSATRTALLDGAAAQTPRAPAREITLERVNHLARRLLRERRAVWSLAGPGR